MDILMLNLLNNVPGVPWVPKCLSTPLPFEYLSALAPWVPECPRALQVLEGLKCSSAWLSWVPACAQVPFECHSAWVPWVPKCPWSALWMSPECWSAFCLLLECPLSAPLVINFNNIIGHGLLNSFVELFAKFFNIYYFLLPWK